MSDQITTSIMAALLSCPGVVASSIPRRRPR